MAENTQAVEATTEEHGHAPVDFGEQVIGFLGGLIVGAIAFGIAAMIVSIIHASEAPGWTVASVLESLKLVPPPGVSLSGIPAVVLYPPENETVDFIINLVLDYGAYFVGFVATIWGYTKIMSMDGEK